jgi:sialidase-1
MNVRNKHKNRRRGVSWSEDGGLTWSPPELAAALVGPVCQASLLRAGESAALLFSNPASTSRERMTVRVSHDGGDSWSEGRLLWHGPAAYSCLTPLPGGGYGCLFEAGETSPYESIRFARFTLEHLNDGD